MRIFPTTISEEKKAADDLRVKEITRKVAIAVAFAAVFIFFIKLLSF